MPAGVFSIGINDSASEVIALSICIPGFFIATVLALWKRRIAGIILLALVVCFFYGMQAERTYMETVRHFPPDQTYGAFFLDSVRVVWMYLALGLFAVTTKSWPEVIKRRGRKAS
jgi:hypothetical protein